MEKICCSEPAILPIRSGMEKFTSTCVLSISGMHCFHCAVHIQSKLQFQEGVYFAYVDQYLEKAEVQYDVSKISPAQIAGVVALAGGKNGHEYSACVLYE